MAASTTGPVAQMVVRVGMLPCRWPSVWTIRVASVSSTEASRSTATTGSRCARPVQPR